MNRVEGLPACSCLPRFHQNRHLHCTHHTTLGFDIQWSFREKETKRDHNRQALKLQPGVVVLSGLSDHHRGHSPARLPRESVVQRTGWPVIVGAGLCRLVDLELVSSVDPIVPIPDGLAYVLVAIDRL